MNARANDVITRDEVPAPMVNTATSLLQVIQQAATNPAVDIDKMERLMAMHERMIAREAEQAFNEAMVACQTEIKRVAPDADNPQTRSKYASYPALDRVLRPVYTRHGFALSFDEGDSPKPEHVRVLCYVSHIKGHTRTYHRDMPADGKGAKGGDVMTKTHAAGAAGSYGARYLLKGIFNVAVAEDDRDGNDPPAMALDALEEWVKKIEAATTKPDAKKVWQVAHKEASRLKDLAAAERLKQALMDHAEFIDKAAK